MSHLLPLSKPRPLKKKKSFKSTSRRQRWNKLDLAANQSLQSYWLELDVILNKCDTKFIQVGLCRGPALQYWSSTLKSAPKKCKYLRWQQTWISGEVKTRFSVIHLQQVEWWGNAGYRTHVFNCTHFSMYLTAHTSLFSEALAKIVQDCQTCLENASFYFLHL